MFTELTPPITVDIIYNTALWLQQAGDRGHRAEYARSWRRSRRSKNRVTVHFFKCSCGTSGPYRTNASQPFGDFALHVVGTFGIGNP